MKRHLLFMLSILLILLLLPCPVAADETAPAEETADAKERVVLTIGDLATRSGNRYDENLGLWQYLAELVGVEIRYVYLSTEEWTQRLRSAAKNIWLV